MVSPFFALYIPPGNYRKFDILGFGNTEGGTLKVEPECYICLLERALKIAQLASSDREKVVEVLKGVSELLIREFTRESVPAIIGTKRERVISEILGIEDPYRKLKEESNRVAAEIVQEIFAEIDLDDISYANFRRVMILAAAANAMEWFIRGHRFSLEIFDNELKAATENLAIDDSQTLYGLVKGRNILYLLDNAGEAVVDLWVVRYLKKLAKRVVVGAKSRPVLNDITVDEARSIGFEEVADALIPTGEYVGVVLEYATEELRRELSIADVIIAKGMGSFETLTEYRLGKPIFVILKAKCVPVARILGVEQGKLVIKRIA